MSSLIEQARSLKRDVDLSEEELKQVNQGADQIYHRSLRMLEQYGREGSLGKMSLTILISNPQEPTVPVTLERAEGRPVITINVEGLAEILDIYMVGENSFSSTIIDPLTHSRTGPATPEDTRDYLELLDIVEARLKTPQSA